MNKKHILILMAHPRKSSLCNALAEEYKRGAEDSGAEVRFIQLIDLNLDLNFNSDIYRENNHIPSEVVRSCQDDLVWADHIVFIYPIWWGSYPALLKGYLDTVFMSRFAYKYKKFWPIDIPKGLLKGKSARIIQTSGGPNILAWPLFGSLFGTVYPGERALRDGTLRFCGIFNVKISRLDNLQNNASQKRIQKFLRKVYRLGSKHK